MNEQEFLSYINRLSEWDRNAIAITLFSAAEPLVQQQRILMLKDRAASLGISEAEFYALYEKDIEGLNRGQKKYRLDNLENYADAPEFFKEKRFLHHVMAEYLIQKCGVCKINNVLHVYKDGIYRPGEDFLQGLMLQLVPDLTESKRREVFRYMAVSFSTPTKELSPPNLIPFKSKIYDINTNAFLDYTPEHVFLNRFPYDYKLEAGFQKRIADTIYQIAGFDAEVIDLLFEAIGNCFYLLNSYRGAVMLYGNGSNGKSTLLNIIIQLLGRENVSSLSLQDTSERFRLARIYGKVANIGDDISGAYFPDSSTFKKLVTGESVVAENKGKDPFEFKSFAKMFFALNELPAVSDKSKGFFGRLLLIPLTVDFSKQTGMNAELKDCKWTEDEMQWLLAQAIEGLNRLRKNGDFTRPQIVIDALREYQAENDPVQEFLQEYGDVNGRPIVEAYSDFTEWCRRAGHKGQLTRTRFAREVGRITGLKSTVARHPYFNGHVGRCFAEPQMF